MRARTNESKVKKGTFSPENCGKMRRFSEFGCRSTFEPITIDHPFQTDSSGFSHHKWCDNPAGNSIGQ
jgi:hypothetical protein